MLSRFWFWFWAKAFTLPLSKSSVLKWEPTSFYILFNCLTPCSWSASQLGCLYNVSIFLLILLVLSLLLFQTLSQVIINFFIHLCLDTHTNIPWNWFLMSQTTCFYRLYFPLPFIWFYQIFAFATSWAIFTRYSTFHVVGCLLVLLISAILVIWTYLLLAFKA